MGRLCGCGCGFGFAIVDLGGRMVANRAEDHRNEEERGQGGEHEPADHRAAERRVLFAAVAQAERHGQHPRIMAVAVMITGRNRVRPASRAALAESTPSRRRSIAKVTTRMLLAVATPMLISVPIRAGTLSVVPVRNRPQTMPARVPGSAIRMTSGSIQDWKFNCHQEIDEDDGSHDADGEPLKDAFIACGCPVKRIVEPRGRCGRTSSIIFWTRDATAPRSVPSTPACTSMVRAML